MRGTPIKRQANGELGESQSAAKSVGHDDRRAWLGVFAAAFSIFLFVADSGLMAVTLPSIESEFPGVPRSTIAWLASSFVIAQASTMLIAGHLGETRGRKRIYLWGLLLFTSGALALTLVGSVPLLICARIVQGTGAAFLTAGALPIVLPLFPTDRAPRVVGVWGAIGSVAAWLAPTAGGFLVSINWRYAFAAVVPFGVLGLFLAVEFLPKDTRAEQSGSKREGGVDRIGLALGPPGFGLFMLVLSQGRRWGWLATPTVTFATISVAMIIGFLLRCRRASNPLLDLALFETREYSANVVGGMLQQIGFFSYFLTAPLVMTQLWGWSPKTAGLALAGSQLTATIGSPLAGWFVELIGPYPVFAIGALVAATGGLLLIVASEGGISLWTGFLPSALLIGFGASWCGTVSSGTALAVLPRTLLGKGNSAQQLLRRAGGSLGVALAVALLGNGKGPAILDGAKRVWWLGVCAHLLMFVPLAMVWRPTKTRGYGNRTTAPDSDSSTT